MSSLSKDESRGDQEHDAPTPQRQPLEGLGQAHPCDRDHMKASRSEKTPPSAPSWPHQHHQTQHHHHTQQQSHHFGLQDDVSREKVLWTQHRHPTRQAGSWVFTQRPNSRDWSSTTAPPARRRRPKPPLPSATTKSMSCENPRARAHLQRRRSVNTNNHSSHRHLAETTRGLRQQPGASSTRAAGRNANPCTCRAPCR